MRHCRLKVRYLAPQLTVLVKKLLVDSCAITHIWHEIWGIVSFVQVNTVEHAREKESHHRDFLVLGQKLGISGDCNDIDK